MTLSLRHLALVALVAPLVASPAPGEPASGARAKSTEAGAAPQAARTGVRGWDPVQKKAFVGKKVQPQATAPGALVPSLPEPALRKGPGQIKYGDITLKKGYVEAPAPPKESVLQRNQTNLEFLRERAARHEATHSVQQKKTPGSKR